MGINVSTSIRFENKDFLQNSAKKLLQKNGASEQKASEVAQMVNYDKPEYASDCLFVLRSSAQITLNNSLKETLKYLQAHANDKRRKEYILGELWESISDKNDAYQGELEDIVINLDEPNIFAA